MIHTHTHTQDAKTSQNGGGGPTCWAETIAASATGSRAAAQKMRSPGSMMEKSAVVAARSSLGEERKRPSPPGAVPSFCASAAYGTCVGGLGGRGVSVSYPRWRVSV